MAYIIAIANEKGGVAKTTTTLSLGASLAENGARVLLVDLDAQANLSLAVGIQPDQVKQSVANILLDSVPLSALCRPTEIEGVEIVAANSELITVERFLPMRRGYETALRDLIRKVDQRYDYILMDCPPFLGAITLAALSACNLLLIPTQPEYFSIYALRSMVGVIRKVRAQGNPNLAYRLLLTMHDRRNRVHRALTEQLRQTFNSGVLETVIDIDTRLRESPIAGKPIQSHAPKCRATAQYRALAQEIIAYVQETSAQPA